MSGLFALDPSAHLVEAAIGEGDHVKGIDHLGGLGQDHRVDGRVGRRHVKGTVSDARLPGLALAVEKTGHVNVIAGRQDVDDPVVLDVGDRRGVRRVVPAELDEARLVEADRARTIQALGVGLSSASP